MPLFVTPPVERIRSRTIGWTLLAIAAIIAIVVSALPSPYVIELPGPVFNTLGAQTIGSGSSAKKIALIKVSGHRTYPTSGALDMLTVSIDGTATQRPSWLSVVRALLTPSEAVIPATAIYPPGQTTQQVNQADQAQMTDSQQSAIAAALIHAGYSVPSILTVAQVQSGSAASGVMKQGDVIESVNGTSLTTDSDTTVLRDLVAKNGAGKPAQVVVKRDGADIPLTVTPKLSDGAPLLGVVVSERFRFPFDVSIQLQNVGGPSAGMMFALGIIDTITPGSLNGGRHVAGTGTITAGGQVGPIGGIRQKLYGARAAGATVFLAPKSNCNEVVGHIPSGLSVYAVSTLDQAVHDLDTIAAGGSTAGLARCSS
ncbi:YlbL family protein [Curtobacterium ammoniigenes]|uniref:YlbL family protein n=1 Tax=Curtobacterium ammoniigenes TaxID=395387 RepID=UPI000A57F844|nr:S16 family serine protease [Curtobacterium ammoniigenes]